MAKCLKKYTFKYFCFYKKLSISLYVKITLHDVFLRCTPLLVLSPTTILQDIFVNKSSKEGKNVLDFLVFSL